MQHIRPSSLPRRHTHPAGHGSRSSRNFPSEGSVMTDAYLVEAIEAQRGVMVSVATGGRRIQEMNDDYIRKRGEIREALRERGLQDPNPYADLWAWYGKW